MQTSLPRTLLLTRWSPTARYAGGEAIRKIIGELPHDALRWAYLTQTVAEDGLRLPAQRGFPPRELHWRLRTSALRFFFVHGIEAPRLARQIAEWVADFRPEVLWVASDMEAIGVAACLRRQLRIPVHATVYDAFENCWIFGVPAVFRPFYLGEVRCFLRKVSTLDAVSAELLDHLARGHPGLAPQGRTVFPVSIARRALANLPPKHAPDPAVLIRRIGFCGASRGSHEQWDNFLSCLGRLPWSFVIVAFPQMDHFHRLRPPINVTLDVQPYAPTEADVMRKFRECGVQACYLALTKEHSQQLFARTSLSSKLSTYAGAGVPVIADAPAASVAWRLVSRHGAGVRCTEDAEETVGSLKSLFGDPAVWQRMAEGADRLCAEEFDLDRNVARFQDLLRAAAGVAPV
jgi:hypothetical protein